MQTVNILKADSAAFVELQDLPDAIDGNIREQATRLCQEYPQAIDCKVSVKTPAFCKEGCYQVEIEIVLSGRVLKIERSPNLDCYQEDLYVAIWSAFNLAKKQLKQHLSQFTTGIDRSSVETNSRRLLRRTIGYAGG